MKWNASYVTLVVFPPNLPKMNQKKTNNVEMSFENHIGHVLFNGAALKNQRIL